MSHPAEPGNTVVVRPAGWPEDGPTAACLLRNYAMYLAAGPAKICLGNLDAEIAAQSQLWSQPNGVLLLAFVNGDPAGCVAVKVRHDRAGACEMKRLWVESGFRGLRVGRLLAEAAIAWSRSRGADVLLLDTHPSAMPEAVSLYRSLGFADTERHNDNPVPGVTFMHRMLQ